MRTLQWLDRAVALVAERRVREAETAGELDDLPGAGRPIPGIDDPYDPDWWLKRWLQREQLASPAAAGPR